MTLRVQTAYTDADLDAFITVAEAVTQCRAEGLAEHEPTIARLRRTALADVEACVQRRYLTQTLDWVLQAWPRDGILRLPVAPVASVTSVKYRDPDNAEQTVDAADYRERPVGQGLAITASDVFCWPLLGDHAEPVTVRFVAGLSGAELALQRPLVKDVVLLRLQALYDQTDFDVGDLLSSERWT